MWAISDSIKLTDDIKDGIMPARNNTKADCTSFILISSCVLLLPLSGL